MAFIPGSKPGAAQELNTIVYMAVIYDNRVCIYANELIMYTPKYKVGSDKGFLPFGTYKSKVRRKKINVVLHACLGRQALVEFDSLEDYIQRLYIKYYGDPHEDVERPKMSLLERTMSYNEAAFTFFTSEYKDAFGKRLSPEKAAFYTLQARVLDAVIRLRNGNAEGSFGRSGERFSVWDRLSEMVNDLTEVRDSKGGIRYPHKLPTTGKTLKRKVDQYEIEGFIALVHKNKGNISAALIKDEEDEAIMHKLLSQHMNLDNMQIMKQYNKVAVLLGKPEIKSPVTVDRYRKMMEATTLGHQRGAAALRNRLEMQHKREAPKTAMTYWTLDGWDVELVYQKKQVKPKTVNGKKKNYMTTTYHNRKTIVVVLDACKKYPIGYAIGDHESPALIREALRNAIKHAWELFGNRYKPIQLQSDNYQKGVMVPFYEALTKYYTPAAIGNAKSKIIEPYFNYLNKTYYQLEKNWSGVNINSRRESQPNVEILNRNRHLIPDEAGVLAQIHGIMRKERAKKLDAYLAAWEGTPDERRLPFSDEEYLMLMGDTTGRTNRLTGKGLLIELAGERINFESFNMELRNHYNEDWVVHYDPDDLSQVLICNAEATKGHYVKKEIGDLRFLMHRDIKTPMALVDQKPEHFEHRKKVNEFNRQFEQRYIEKQEHVDEVIYSMRERIPLLKSNNLLDRALILDSKGRHKDRKYEAREDVQDVEYEEISSGPVKILPPVADDDYEWSTSDMSFSR